MAIFNEFPYTNIHEINLDWIIARVKEWLAVAENWELWKTDIQTAFDELKAYVMNLDLNEEVSNKLDQMAEDGTLAEIINQEIFGDLEERVEDLEYFQRVYQNWEGWETYITKDGYLSAGCVRVVTVTEKNSITGSEPNYYSEEFSIALPTPVKQCAVTLTGGGDGAWVVCSNYKYIGARFRVWFPFDYTTPKTVAIRLNVITSIRVPEQYTSKSWSGTNATALINIAKSYVEAQRGGRSFAYGANWFYVTERGAGKINNANGAGLMECDTFVGLCLRGIPYNKSPYVVTTPGFMYMYEDLYTDVSNAVTWAANTAYSVGDIISITGQLASYYRCTRTHTSGAAFDSSFWNPIWITNPDNIAWATLLNNKMHPENPFIGRDIRFAPDLAFLAWDLDSTDVYPSIGVDVFQSVERASSGDIAFWVRRSHDMTYWGGYSQSPGFDNIGHVGIVGVEQGVKYIYHCSSNDFTEGRVVEKRLLSEFDEQPTYFARLV